MFAFFSDLFDDLKNDKRLNGHTFSLTYTLAQDSQDNFRDKENFDSYKKNHFLPFNPSV